MFEPIRGGTRGGQGEFKWADVSADKDRENYLGHSINAPTGRWQKNKDVHWYNRDLRDTDAERAEEIRKIKEAEAEALSIALGFAPSEKTAEGSPSTTVKPTDEEADRAKEEKRRLKAERKQEKRARKEAKRSARSERHVIRDRDSRSRSRSRSASPRPRERHRERDYVSRRERLYEEDERERERERDRRRWDTNNRRNEPGGSKWGRDR